LERAHAQLPTDHKMNSRLLAFFLCSLLVERRFGEEMESRFFSTVRVQTHATVRTDSDGDLWPCCWAADDRVYTANGDGAGFLNGAPRPAIPDRPDIAVGWIEGYPPNLVTGHLAESAQIGSIWTKGKYNRKPTGMLCLEGTIYLAVQDLSFDFNEVPAASISWSTDGGRTWEWDKSKPMFPNHAFTTIFFLDYGKNQEHAPKGWVYAYGLDGNWRDSFNNRVADPTELFLARIPKEKIRERHAWEFYAGVDVKGEPIWSKHINARMPVLESNRRVYSKTYGPLRIRDMSVISQGSVVYNAPLKRYLYTSWTEYTFEFYEAPEPWGPWKRFLSYDFGGYPWTTNNYGGYAATIPSKFISADGRTMWVQCNTFVGGVEDYGFSLRKLEVTPYQPSTPRNEPNRTKNLAEPSTGAVPVFKSIRGGRSDLMNDGRVGEFEDDWDREIKKESWWGYTWPRSYRMTRLVYSSGPVTDRGGGFEGVPKVQVRQEFRWMDIPNARMTSSETGEGGVRLDYTFPEVVGDGIRVIGQPAGTNTYTTVGEVEVYYDPG
jgi:hypothetical protein